MKKNILLVEYNSEAVDTIKEILHQEIFDIKIAGNEKIAKKLLKKQEFHMVITEALLPKSHGFTLSKYISDNYSGLKIIIISEKLKDVDYRKEALEHGACEFFEKPLNPIEFKEKVAKHLNITEQEQKKYHNETTKINIIPLLNKNKSGEKEIDSKEEDIVEKLKKELNPYEIKLD